MPHHLPIPPQRGVGAQTAEVIPDASVTYPGGVTSSPRRRTPRLVSFLFVGAILGFAVGGYFGVRGGPMGGYSVSSSLGYFGVFGIFIGGILGGIAYLVADRATR